MLREASNYLDEKGEIVSRPERGGVPRGKCS
jgi:hypothetical protein